MLTRGQFVRSIWAPVACTALVLAGCNHRDYGVETFPVTGLVCVDGAPTAQVSVTLHRVGGMDKKTPTVSATISKEDGSFAISTFEDGDGVPAGDYVATFTWAEFNPISRSMGPDKLKGKYNDPDQSQFKVSVAPGAKVDMGRIELVTK